MTVRNPRQHIGQQIRALRRQYEFSLDDLAKAAGVSASHLSRLERGHTVPSFIVLANIAHIFDISLDDLADLEQELESINKDLGTLLIELGLSQSVCEDIEQLPIDTRRQLLDALRKTEGCANG